MILGGTQFIGRCLVEHLLNYDQYSITLFNRQQTNSQLFTHIDKIKGDRETEDIKQIKSQNWDYVIDLSCYYPKALSLTLDHLSTAPEKYILISTCSVYDNHAVKSTPRSESAPTLGCDAEQVADRSLASYGNRKAECERILAKSGINHLILRPALVYGPYDNTDRFYYWLYNTKHLDRVLLPDHGTNCFSITYVNDLVKAITAGLINSNFKGIVNAISHPEMSIAKIVSEASELLKKSPELINVSRTFLNQQQIRPWMDIPLWLEENYFRFSNNKMLELGDILLDSFELSLIETIQYYRELNWPIPQYGISLSKHKELLGRVKMN